MHDERVYRGRCCDVSGVCGCGACLRIAALLYALSWVAVRAMLVCGCPASKGGILRAISPAGRRFRASALVSGRKNHDVYAYMCTFFLVVAFRDARFLSGLYGRFSYIVNKR